MHRYTVYAQGRMAQRQITDQEVQHVLLCAEAEVIEEYPTDKYSPSCLLYGVTALGRVLHVQSNHQGGYCDCLRPRSGRVDRSQTEGQG
jgi:hypothetical protein